MSWLTRLLFGSRADRPSARGAAPASPGSPAPTATAPTAPSEDILIEQMRAALAAGRAVDVDAMSTVAEQLGARGDRQAARPLLDALTRSSRHRVRAHAALALADEQAGDSQGARRHWSAVIAYDFDYPGARAALGALRGDLRSATVTGSETLLGIEEVRAGVGERYRLRRELGRGASGTVYVAFDERLQREVALKLLHPASEGSFEAQSWLATKRVASLSHPNVILLYDLDESRRAITMELCRGGSLADIVARGPLSAPDAIARAIELASALALVHDAGIVHGDIKPANLFLRDETASSDLVLSDFGITGTLAYMPQEARTAQSSLSPASDIYATAVVLLEMLHGTEALAPLLRDSAAILRGTARWNEQLPPTLGTAAAPLRALILRMLADDSADRPRASDVHAALVELRDTTPT